MNKRFTKISTLLATVLLSIILIFACGIAGPTTGGTTDTTTGGGGGDSSLSIMPTAVFSTSPELAAAASVGSIDFPFAYFFNTGTRADSGILNPEKMSELFMPLFTGLKTPKAGEMSNNLTVDYVGYYLKRPILIKMVDKTAENTDDNFAKVFEFSYYQDNNANKIVDVGGLETDTQVAFVLIKTYTDAATSGEWTLTQLIANPFNPTEKFSMKASGIYGPTQLTGDGTFTATSGDYKGSAAVTWTKNSSGKKFIRIEEGKIEYKGTAANGYYNVTGLNITIDVSADNSSKVTEASTVVTKNADGTTLTIVKQASTLNDNSGLPKEVAFTISKTLKDINGIITDNTTKQGAKTIAVDSTFKIAVTDIDATNLNIGDLTVTDNDATAAKITVNLSKCPTTAMGKSVKVWIVKPENMVYESNGTVHPNVTIARVAEMKGVVSSTYGASFTTTSDIPAGNYVVYAIIDPMGDFPATPTVDNVGPTTTDDFYAYSIGVFVDGRKGVTTVNMGNAAIGEPGWMKFGSATMDVRPSLEVSITFTSKDANPGFTSTAIAGKMMQLGLFEVTSMGINWNAPVGFSYIQLATPSIGTTLTGNKLYIDGIVDFKNKKYTVGARLDMDGDQMDSVGDFYYMDTTADVALKFDNYNNKYYISIPGFVYLAELKTDTIIDYSKYTKDGKPLTDSVYYASTGGATISGSVDFTMIDKYQASAWFAILMPLVNGPEEGTNTPPVAFAQVNSTTGAFTFSNIRKFIGDNTATPNYYNIVAVGYRNFDINYDKLRMPYQDDILAMKATTYEYTYYDAQGKPVTATNYSNSPLALTFNAGGSMVGIKWIDNDVYQPDITPLTAANLKLDLSMLYMDATSGDTGTSSGISIGTGDKPVYVTVGFDDPMNFQYSSTDRPYWLSDTSFGVKIEKKVNGIWTYVTENWSNFRDSAYNAIYYVSFDCKDANLNAVYRFTVSQETFNPDKNMPVKFTGSSGEITISDNNYAYIGLKEEPVVVLSGTDDVEIILQLPEMVTDTIYTKSALTGKYAYVELMDQNFVSKYIMKLKIEDTTYSYDGTNSYPIFGAKGTFTSVPKYNYYFRAFIDWNGNVTTAMDVGITYQTSSKPNVFPDPEDIHPNLSNWTPVVSMDYEKYTDPNTNFTYPYSLWFSDWIEVTWGGTTGSTVPVGDTYTLGINYDNSTGTDLNAYYMVMDSVNTQIESGSVLIPKANGAAPEYVNLYNLTSGMSYTVYVYVDTSVGGAVMWPDAGEPSFSTTYAPDAMNMTVFANAFTPYVDGGTGGTQPTILVNYANTYASEMKVWLKVLNTDMTVYETKEGYITANGTSTSFTLTNNYDGMTDYNVEVYIDANQDYNISTGDKALTGVSYKIASDSSILVDTFFDYTDGGTTSTTVPMSYGIEILYNNQSAMDVYAFYRVIDASNPVNIIETGYGIIPPSNTAPVQIYLSNAVANTGYDVHVFLDVNGVDSTGAATVTSNPDFNDTQDSFKYFTNINFNEFYVNCVADFNGGTAVGTININYPGFMGKNIYVRVYDYAMQFPFEPSSGWIAGTLDATGMANIQLMGVYTEAAAYYVEVLIDTDGLTASMATDQMTAWPETGDYHTDTLVPFSFTNGIQVPVGESNFVLVP